MLRQVSYAIFGPTGDHLRTIVVPNADRITDLMHGGVRGTQPYPGTVDIVAETMTVNCERKKSVDFSSVYYLAGQEVLVRRGSAITSDAGMAGRRVCAAQKSTSLQNLANLNLKPPIGLVTAVNQTDCLVMLQQGQVDAVSTDDTILRGMAAQDPTLQLIGPAIQPEPYGMAISKNNKLLTQFVNAVLDKERCDGTWKALYKKWLDVYTPGVVPNPPGRRAGGGRHDHAGRPRHRRCNGPVALSRPEFRRGRPRPRERPDQTARPRGTDDGGHRRRRRGDGGGPPLRLGRSSGAGRPPGARREPAWSPVTPATQAPGCGPLAPG